MSRNKHGLSRDLPSDVALTVRQKCGFGCVICGQAICDYEHIDPEFKDATHHDPEKIVLLCPGCHSKVTRKFLSKDSVKIAALNPKTKSNGFSFDKFDIGPGCPSVTIGNIRSERVRCIIKIDDDEILSVKPPTSHGGPFLLSARLINEFGEEILSIVDNIFQVRDSSWDVTISGGKIRIFSNAKNISLYLRTENPGKIIIEKIRMKHKNVLILAKEGKDTLILCSSIGLRATNWVIDGHDVALDFSNHELTVGNGLSPYRNPSHWGVSFGQTIVMKQSDVQEILQRKR
jgi:hypothetical protein